ncbi:malto-oligosyltrehalose synthase [Pontibacter ruber]|uniref:Malto-oligosyltrehalose synthase n=1 Tax=Pontibacter ruber TaxID=1343895 RepID=A0ABW5CY10_9BACT|nr:malto-oligosyltrehalose synthase [Pontibacter ruber]
MVYIPSSTYRLQISPEFKLEHARRILPYLKELGISTVYAAPFFSAKSGSAHGYDVTNPHQINPEAGTLQEFQELAKEVQELGMGWLQDIVPNHMAFSPENEWLMDVLEKGPQSEFYTFFDIDFNHPDFKGKVMVPFLGEPLEKVLEQEQLKLQFTNKGFCISYFDSNYPLNLAGYETLLNQVAAKAETEAAGAALKAKLHHLQMVTESDIIDGEGWKKAIAELHQTLHLHKELQTALKQVLQSINSDQNKLKELLEQQYFILCYWQDTEKQMGYRRFFTVNELICLAMERKDSFDKYHRLIKQLCDEKLVQGLRVDHVDGLYDPDTYLQRLRELAGEEVYLIVEKILEGEENLPDYWPIQGNSGYDYLAWVSNLLTAQDGEEKLTNVYQNLVPDAAPDYEDLVFEKKRYILEHHMRGELQNLLRLLQTSNLMPQEQPEEQVREALTVLLAAFPVYRIYGSSFPLPEGALPVVDKAFAEARRRAPQSEAALMHLRSLFEANEHEDEERKKQKLYFVMRTQQFTGPLAAKGVEDTTFYNYNRLIALNEVGNSPAIFSLSREEFHERMKYKLETYPHSLNATATHDTKRGEDARTRLFTLSEIPDEWEKQAAQWMEIAEKNAREVKITRNDLYFLFQTLLGVMPMDGNVDDTLIQRLEEFLPKALREAKANSNWTEPNEKYEDALKGLTKQLLQKDEAFMASFKPFFKRVAHYGWLSSLTQTLLKLTCPGVPDVYQGCEFWDYSLVDPDNRRPVDYELRQQYLQEIRQQEKNDPQQLHQQLLQNPADARVKLYLLSKTLHLRRQMQELFSKGNYLPLTVIGSKENHAMAFARHYQGQWCLVVVPGLLASLVKEDELPLGEQVWGDTSIELPADLPQQWQHAFSQEEVKAEQNKLSLSTLLKTFPVALLTAES